MKIFVALAVLISTVNALSCGPSSRFDWIDSTIMIGSPWTNYTSPNDKCCDTVDPQTPIDFDVECSLCYGRTHSTPGFMLDPNNCQKFFMCVPTVTGGFIAHQMTCPDCMFWDDDKLSCVEVSTACRVSVSVPTGTPNPEFTHEPLVSCIDFENAADLSTKGMYVMNNGVTVVTNGQEVAAGFCPQGNSCGQFNTSQLHVPFFANNYNSLPNLKITFEMYATPSTNETFYQAIISNDCVGDLPGHLHNTLFVAYDQDLIGYKVSDSENRTVFISEPVQTYEWQSVTCTFSNTEMSLIIEGVNDTRAFSVPLKGIGESHCPLVIGSLINDALVSYFKGFIDNMCFSIDYEQ